MTTERTTSMTADETTKSIPDSRLFLPFLYLTTVISGALVMLLEILGARLIGPFFGINLFVWTSVIAVTLVSLTLGYAAGGYLADRRPHPSTLYSLVAVAGMLTLSIPWTRPLLLTYCLPWGLRAGCLAASLLLLGPPLGILGCMTPYVIKIATRRLGRLGRTVGGLTALSTLGSIAGTILTGFLLIPTFGVLQIVRFAGILLMLVSALYFVLFTGKRALALLLLPSLLLAASGEELSTKLQPNGTRLTIVHRRYSYYGTIKVVDYTYGRQHTRELLVDGMVQGGVDMRNGLSVYEYAYFLTHLVRRMHPKGKRCLAIGIGAGLAPAWYAEQGVLVDAIDIDPRIVEVARTYFGFRVNGEVLIGDARVRAKDLAEPYDYILLDVFSGEAPPFQLLSRESFELMHAKLAPGGILAMNMIGSLDLDQSAIPCVIKTLRAVFDRVHLFPTYTAEAGETFGNIEIIAYDGTAREIPDRVDFPVSPIAADRLRRSFGREYPVSFGGRGVMLTDDYNPIDLFDLPVRFALRRSLLRMTDWELLL